MLRAGVLGSRLRLRATCWVIAALGVVSSLTFFSPIGRAEAPLELPELAAQIRPSVVHLSILDASGQTVGSGTGFFVEGGRVVTNHHVVMAARRVVAKLSDGREIEVLGVLESDPERDLAILAVEGANLPPPLPLGDSEKLRQGDSIVVIGSPRGLSGTLSTGIVSAVRGEGLASELAEDVPGTGSWTIQITAAVSPGSSGSPILTRDDGTVVGVAVGLLDESASLGFGIPISEVEEMLAELSPDAEVEPFGTVEGSDLTRNLIISAVFFGLIALGFFLPGFLERRRDRRVKRRR